MDKTVIRAPQMLSLLLGNISISHVHLSYMKALLTVHVYDICFCADKFKIDSHNSATSNCRFSRNRLFNDSSALQIVLRLRVCKICWPKKIGSKDITCVRSMLLREGSVRHNETSNTFNCECDKLFHVRIRINSFS